MRHSSPRRAGTSPSVRRCGPRVALGASLHEDVGALRALVRGRRLDDRLRIDVGLALARFADCARCRTECLERAQRQRSVTTPPVPAPRAQVADPDSSQAATTAHDAPISRARASARERAAREFVCMLAARRGDADDALLALPRDAGFRDAEIAELVALTGLILVQHCLAHGERAPRSVPRIRARQPRGPDPRV